MNDAAGERSRRRRRHVVTAILLAALLAPVVTDRDSFPLSTYPMYARQRSQVVSIATASGITTDGRREQLSLEIIGNSDDPLIVAGELRAAIRAGRAATRCAEIAERSVEAERRHLVAIEITTERLDAAAFVTGEASVVDRTVHARCGLAP